MEKDIDEVGKIARNVKGKLEAVNKDVILDVQYFQNLFGFSQFSEEHLHINSIFFSPELDQ